ncbi:MAG: hypothetical protein J5793_00125, partial [Clostridia bacterium]|nr:hypothetical protein [Clostridia bacterium]
MNDKNEKKIFDATAHIDEELVDSLVGKNIKRSRGRITAIIAVAAAAAILIGSLAGVLLSVRNGQDDTSGGVSDHSETSQGDGDQVPPWRNGELHLTTLVYDNADAYAFTEGAIIRTLSARAEADEDGADAGFEPEEEPSDELSDELESEYPYDLSDFYLNVSVSLRPNTKISAFSGSDLIKVDIGSGVHADCYSVWYDVKKNKTVCLSCLIRDAISGTGEYLDACVRLALACGMVSDDASFAGMYNDEYKTLYELLYSDTALELFASGKKPTVKSLGLTGTFADSQTVKNALKRFKYPQVFVLEYGEDPGKCLYTLTGLDLNISFGVYVFDFESNSCERILTNSRIGDPKCCEGPIGIELLAPNFAMANEVRVTGGYTGAVIDVPYFAAAFTEYDFMSGSLAPHYGYSTIMVYGEGEKPRSVLDQYPDAESTYYSIPAGGLEIDGDVISFKAADGRTGFSIKGGKVYFLEGERLVLTRDNDSAPVVIMLQNGVIAAYRLRSGKAELLSAEELVSSVSEQNRSVLEGNVYTDLATGNETMLFDAEPFAYTVSKDRRYAYFYFGEGVVDCVDLVTGERGILELDPGFEAQFDGMDGVTFCLFLSSKGDELLLAYYIEGRLFFDREAYAKVYEEYRDSYRFISMGGSGNTDSFNNNFRSVLTCYRINGEAVTIGSDDKKRMLELGRLLSAPVLMKRLMPEMTQAHHFEISKIMTSCDYLADLAETLIPYLEYSGNRVYLKANSYRDLMPETMFEFDLKYDDLFWYIDREIMICAENTLDSDVFLDTLAREIANTMVRTATGYLSPDGFSRDDALRSIEANKYDHESYQYRLHYLETLDGFYMQFNAGIDTVKAEELRQKLIKAIKPLLPEPHKSRDGSAYGIYDREFQLAFDSCWDAAFKAVFGDTYPVFLKDAGFLDQPYCADFFVGHTAKAFGVIELDYPRVIDRAALKVLLAELDLTPSDVSVDAGAAVYLSTSTSKVRFISAGCAEDGRYYLTSYGYAAEITEEQYGRFENICGGET